MKKKRRTVRKSIRVLLCLLLALGLVAVAFALGIGKEKPVTEPDPVKTEEREETVTEEKESEPEKPVEPHAVSTASVGVTGDILIHSTVYNGAQQADGSYNFAPH